MIEFCTVKRMAMLGTSLIVLCLIVLGVENALTTRTSSTHETGTNSSGGTFAKLTGKEHCWQSENYIVKDECRECSSFEKVSGHMPICQKTGFKELVTCEKTGDIYKSCPRLPWLEKRNFWLFEFTMILIGLLSWTVVFLRRKQLDLKMLQRIQKQISAGV